MENNKSKNIIIVLLIIIILILAVLCVLFATDVIMINKGQKENITNNIVDNKTNDDEVEKVQDEDNNKADDELVYKPIIDEYVKFINASNDEVTDYIYVNLIEGVSLEDRNFQRAYDWYYLVYDINSDGTNEFFIAYNQNDTYEVLNVFTYENDNIKRVSEYWGRNHFYAAYDSGILVGAGSSGADVNDYEFINLDGHRKNFVINTEGNNIKIQDSNMQPTTYKTIADLISDNIDNGTVIELENLNWKSIK